MVGGGFKSVGTDGNLIHFTECVEVLGNFGAGSGEVRVEHLHPRLYVFDKPLLIGLASVGQRLNSLLLQSEFFVG